MNVEFHTPFEESVSEPWNGNEEIMTITNRELLAPKKLSMPAWDKLYAELTAAGELDEPFYGGHLGRHFDDGDFRLGKLSMDNTIASLRLWNLLLTEESRLRDDRANGKKLIGTMKDLGTIPVMCYSMPNTTTFYPDGAWWIPCIMELSDQLFAIADSMGIDESFCPVRAMIGAFAKENHFPHPELLICSTGAVCDDFSAIAQRLEGMGHPILWWEVPRRAGACACDCEKPVLSEDELRGCVVSELKQIRKAIEDLCDQDLTDEMIHEGIANANIARTLLDELRQINFTAKLPPFPALEMLIAEMLIIHYCSNFDETVAIYRDMVETAKARVSAGVGYGKKSDVKVFWVNPVADLRIMNLLEECGGRVCGTEYLFTHALDLIDTSFENPLDSLANSILADPMIGPAQDRARRIIDDIGRFGAQAVIVSRIPGASHCGFEGRIITQMVEKELGIPVLEIEVPPMTDSMSPSIRTRIEALIETAGMPIL